MASIKDIQFSMQGEQPVAPVPQKEYQPKALFKKDAAKQDGFVVFKMVNSNRQGGVYIPGVDYVIDPRSITAENPDGNGPEMIRLINGVTTIWAKEQKDVSPEYIKKNTRFIQFPKGTKFISVPKWDKPQLEFMRVCRHNVQNPNRTTGSKFEFFEYDPNEVAKEQLAAEMLQIDMITKASQQNVEKMKKHAIFLGISMTDEIGRQKPDDRLRTDYILAAKRDPEMFKKTLDSKEVDIQFKIRAAIIDGKIDISRGDGKAYYGNGGGVICSIPKSEQPLLFLTNLALTPNKDGIEFKEQLDRLIT